MVGEILCISQSLAAFSEPRSEGEGLAFILSPFRTKDGGCRGTAWLLKACQLRCAAGLLGLYREGKMGPFYTRDWGLSIYDKCHRGNGAAFYDGFFQMLPGGGGVLWSDGELDILKISRPGFFFGTKTEGCPQEVVLKCQQSCPFAQMFRASVPAH